MSLIGRKVTIARLHATVHLEQAGEVKDVLTEAGKNNLKFDMTRVEGGLHLVYGGREVFIPDGNIKSLQFALEQK